MTSGRSHTVTSTKRTKVIGNKTFYKLGGNKKDKGSLIEMEIAGGDASTADFGLSAAEKMHN